MVMWTLVLIALLSAVGNGTQRRLCSVPLWTVDLTVKYHLDSLGALKGPIAKRPMWGGSGIAFVASDKLVVYEVEEHNVTNLETRDPSAGGGRFSLRALFLDARNGREIREMEWTTSAAGYSGVDATHDGHFVVKTGEALRSYSSDFKEIAAIQGPNTFASWFVLVVPPGRLLFADGGSKKILVDADTLQIVRNPNPSDVALWPEADYYFPELVRSQTTQPSHLTWQQSLEVANKRLEEAKHHDCTDSSFVGVPKQTVIPRGCRELDLLTPDRSVWWHLEFHDEVDRLAINGNTLAMQLDRWPWDPLDLGRRAKPIRIAVYDVAERAEECSLDLQELHSSKTDDFAVSADGLFAVRLGSQLSVYEP